MEEKEGNIIGSQKKEDRVLAINKALAELFWPSLDLNQETTEFCIKLASGAGTTIVMELEDPSKAAHHYLSTVNGKWIQKMLLKEEIEVLLSIWSNNDPSESGFSTMTQVLAEFGRIDLFSAYGLG